MTPAACDPEMAQEQPEVSITTSGTMEDKAHGKGPWPGGAVYRSGSAGYG